MFFISPLGQLGLQGEEGLTFPESYSRGNRVCHTGLINVLYDVAVLAFCCSKYIVAKICLSESLRVDSLYGYKEVITKREGSVDNIDSIYSGNETDMLSDGSTRLQVIKLLSINHVFSLLYRISQLASFSDGLTWSRVNGRRVTKLRYHHVKERNTHR